MTGEKLVSELRNFLESYVFPSAAFSLGELKLGNLGKSDAQDGRMGEIVLANGGAFDEKEIVPAIRPRQLSGVL